MTLTEQLQQLEATCSYCYHDVMRSVIGPQLTARGGTSAMLASARKRVRVVLDEPHRVCGLIQDIRHQYDDTTAVRAA